MILSEIAIENFRSIKNCKIQIREISALIGENNAGKTALLRAINSVFNWDFEEKYFLNNSHQHAIKTVSKIILTFDDVPNKDYYRNKVQGSKLQMMLKYSYGATTRKKSLFCIKGSDQVPLEDDFISFLKQDIDYVYIPANRSNRDLIWTENSIFKRLLSAYAQHHTQQRDNISAQVTKVADQLKKYVFSKLEKELSNIGMLEGSESYIFDYSDTVDYTLFLDKVGINIIESGKKLPVTEYGSGIKSLSVIALYRTLAKLQNVNVILGIEEPETNLHPHAQKKLIASIKNKRENTEIQTIIATHSTVIVDELNHEDVVLARRVPNTNRGFVTEYSQLDASFWDDYSLNEQKHNRFFRYKNSDFFFAKYVIIVESSTDAQVISRLISSELGELQYYISILNLNGVKNLKYPYFLLKNLKIPFCMVVDRDFLSGYKNGKLVDSRTPPTFLPEYSTVLNSRNAVIIDCWSKEDEIKTLNQLLASSYTSLFEYCKSKKVFTMQYCLEMDLIANKPSRTRYCEEFRIADDDSAFKALLIDRCDAIKEADKILAVVEGLAPKQYPYSFKKIKKAIVEDITLNLAISHQ